MRNDAIRANNRAGQLVYDYIQWSPFYGGKDDHYIDERQVIELPAIDPDQQFGPMSEQTPTLKPKPIVSQMYSIYQLEQPPQFSSCKYPFKHPGPRLNRYYETLKPYYKLQ
jgi:hypothetical protein